MRAFLRPATVLFAALLFATPSSAGARIGEAPPSGRKHEKFGLDLGARVALSTPTHDSDAFDRGVDLALTLTSMQTRNAGVGFELEYQRRNSPKSGAVLDEFINSFGGSQVEGTQVFVDAFQASLHVRLQAQSDQLLVPWADVGAGLERATGTIDYPVDTVTGPGWQLTLVSSHHVTYSPACSVRAGFDVSSQRGIRVGPDASYQWVFVSGSRQATFTAWALGLHARFGTP